MLDISLQEFRNGYETFQQREKRDSMYKTATFLVEHFWGKPSEMADSLGVLLLTWNQAFYRYGLFDFDKLENCIKNNQRLLEVYRHREILSYVQTDDPQIGDLFGQLLIALQIGEGNTAVGRRSPVSVAKTLHLLAPAFFPLWDDRIARAYGCQYASNPVGKYIVFSGIMKQLASQLQPHINWQATGKTFLKLLDEYNYAKYTKGWI